MNRGSPAHRLATVPGLRALLLILVVLAGCAQAPPQQAATAPPEPSGSVNAVARPTQVPTRIPTAPPAAPPSPERASLTFAFPDDPQMASLVRQLIDAYLATNTTVDITPQPLPAQSYLQELLGAGKGRGYDLMLTTDTQTPALIDNGVLLDIQPLLARLAEPQPDDFYPAARAPWARGWSHYGLPISATPQVLFYNRTLFDARGEPYPTAGWTWEDWFASARRLSEAGGAQPSTYGLTIGGWTTAVWGNGGQLLNADHTLTLLDQPEAAEGVQQFADLITAGVAPLPPTAGGPEPAALFVGQQAAMVPAPISMAARLPADLPFTWAIAPVPAGPTRAVLLSVTGLAVGAESQAPQLATDFIGWAVSPEGQALRAQVQPYGASALTKPEPQAGDTPERQVIRDAVGYGRTLPATAQWPAVAQLVNAALDPVWKGQQTAAAAYVLVAPQINALLATGAVPPSGSASGVQLEPAPTAGPPAVTQETTAAAPTASQPPGALPTPPPAAQPTPVRQLRFVKLNENDDPTCISVGISGIRTEGWAFTVDGTSFRGSFDGGGNARFCGLAPRQEVTLTVRTSNGQTVRGGGGVQSIGGAIMRAEWR